MAGRSRDAPTGLGGRVLGRRPATLAAVAAVGCQSWLTLDGFLVTRFGDPTWQGADDWGWPVAAFAAAGCGLAVGAPYRAVRRSRAWHARAALAGAAGA